MKRWVPSLLLHAVLPHRLQDEMVPPAQMRVLRGLCSSKVVTQLDVPRAHHMDAYDVAPQLYWAALRQFVDKHA
jgi:fermentation-respiration switch protein FrsA (DUF1100 family)